MLWLSEMPGTPPSVNQIPLDTRNHTYRRTRDKWMRDIALLMVETGNNLPRKLEYAECSALLTFPTRRRRDEGNYRSHLDKWLGDLLQHTRRIPDDTPQYYKFHNVAFATGKRETTLLIIEYRIPTLGEECQENETGQNSIKTGTQTKC